MTLGLIGRKCGMSRLFNADGAAIPVTLIQVEPHFVTQVKTLESDGYVALQVTTGNKKRSHVNKPDSGHFAKANVEPGFGLWEFRVSNDLVANHATGSSYHLDILKEGEVIDVAGVTKGKGFAGTVKRHHFRTQDMSHGNSRSHRVPGSIGQAQTPGRVRKGKKMCGHMGVANRTIQGLQVVKIDKEQNLLVVKGSVPGVDNGVLIITSTVKA